MLSLALIIVAFIIWLWWPLLIHKIEEWHTQMECNLSILQVAEMQSTKGKVLNSREVEAEFSELYTMLAVLFTIFATIAALFTYTSAVKDKNKQKLDEISKKSFDRFYKLYDVFESAIFALKDVDGNRGYKVIGALYDKYRNAELECIHRQDWQALEKLDAQFTQDSELLYEPAVEIFRLLNWIRSQREFVKKEIEMTEMSIYAREQAFAEVEKNRILLIGVLADLLTAQTEFVFGKYRHIRYHLRNANGREYRGSLYADAVFKYERTVALWTDKVEAKKLWDCIRERYRTEESCYLSEMAMSAFSKYWQPNESR